MWIADEEEVLSLATTRGGGGGRTKGVPWVGRRYAWANGAEEEQLARSVLHKRDEMGKGTTEGGKGGGKEEGTSRATDFHDWNATLAGTRSRR